MNLGGAAHFFKMNEVFFNLKGFFQVSHEVSASDVGKIYLKMSLEGKVLYEEEV
jgi:hypothetical protein